MDGILRQNRNKCFLFSIFCLFSLLRNDSKLNAQVQRLSKFSPICVVQSILLTGIRLWMKSIYPCIISMLVLKYFRPLNHNTVPARYTLCFSWQQVIEPQLWLECNVWLNNKLTLHVVKGRFLENFMVKLYLMLSNALWLKCMCFSKYRLFMILLIRLLFSVKHC